MLFGPTCFVYICGLFTVSASPELYDWDVLLLSDDKSDLVQKVSPDHCMELLNEDMQYIVTVAWEQFKKEFNKTYADNQEHDKRFKLFCQRFMAVREHNKAYREGKVTFEKGINPFSDQTIEEISLSCCGIPSHNLTTLPGLKYRKLDVELPEHVDWREVGAVTSVRSQGTCGSCWAFSVTGAIEGQDFLHSNILKRLSPQQLIDCATPYGTKGCWGGHPPDAYNYVKEAGGMELDSDYPYVAQGQTCRFDKNKVATRIFGFVEIPDNEQILQQAVALYGPIAVAIDALHLSWVDYKKGIISDPACKNTRRDMNHAILLIGYGTDENGTPYWLIKNSQDTWWGEQGYGRMLRNANNMCGIASYANYPII
ncbi:hypothetical protein CRM22_005427 [Opisthorchis felineus]|uniref:Uncharacterized protein n=1 Tax=Opisthorchis felineus TaxID=147828 RepID=A0A4S2LR42_OPIFE|nr:hypothetical protein CRM22_005427 [Opisthorchis felineus]